MKLLAAIFIGPIALFAWIARNGAALKPGDYRR